jgi:SOS response associated peptidase (SRAP)
MHSEPFWVWAVLCEPPMLPVALPLFGARTFRSIGCEEARAVTCVVTSALAIVPGGSRRRVNCGYAAYIKTMCGRIIQASVPLRYQLVDGLDVPDSRLSNIPRRYNGAPSQGLNHETGERSLDLLKWGLVPSWSGDPKGGPKPINATAETIRRCSVMLTASAAASYWRPR